MALLRSLEDHEYLPEYGTLLVRDTARQQPGRVAVSDLLKEHATDAQPCGSVARAGDGWVDGKAQDSYQAVRLETHDTAPFDDRAGWDAVVEMPFVTGGVVALGTVTGGTYIDQLRLGPPGLYRVRVARRPYPDGEGGLFRLQFWEEPEPRPPCWLARDEPLVPDVPPPVTRLAARRRYSYAASDLVSLVLWAAESRVAPSVGWMGEQLIATPGAVREVLRYAAETGLVTVDGDPDAGTDTALGITVHSRRTAPQVPPVLGSRGGRGS